MKTIKLTQGKFAFIDDKDFERVNQFKWQTLHSNNSYYAVRTINLKGKRTSLLMARYILNVTDPKLDVDHKNHKTLDNRRLNLRVCTRSKNCQNQKRRISNTSGFKGVMWHTHHQKWVARIQTNGKRINLGDYIDPKLAYEAYCKAALKYHKEYAHF